MPYVFNGTCEERAMTTVQPQLSVASALDQKDLSDSEWNSQLSAAQKIAGWFGPEPDKFDALVTEKINSKEIQDTYAAASDNFKKVMASLIVIRENGSDSEKQKAGAYETALKNAFLALEANKRGDDSNIIGKLFDAGTSNNQYSNAVDFIDRSKKSWNWPFPVL
jgi:hypothetical protein